MAGGTHSASPQPQEGPPTGRAVTDARDPAASAAKAPHAQSDAPSRQPPASDAPPATAGSPSISAHGTEYHLDDAEVEYDLPQRSRPHKGRSIEILLRSSPPGAVAAVDGVAIGPTPSLWQGSADGRPRDFTFVLPGYAIARYRFIPIKGGVVHASLDRLKNPQDAGPEDQASIRDRQADRAGP